MIYAYVRVSTDKQCTDNQRFEIEQYSIARALKIDRWIDETVSGRKRIEERQLGRLLTQVEAGDIVITTELSRLGRNLMQVMGFLHQCMERNIRVFTVKEGYELGNNINSQILAFAFSLSAEIERNLISQRTREALARLKNKGVQLGRPRGRQWSKLRGKEQLIRKMMQAQKSKTYMSRTLGVSRTTLRRFIEQHMEGDERMNGAPPDGA